MPPDPDNANVLLASMEQLGRQVSEFVGMHAELKTLHAQVDAAKAERAEEEAKFASAKEERAKYDDDFERWRAAANRQQLQGNAAIDQLNEKLRSLEAAVTEKEQRHESLIAGLQALHARLKV